MTSFLPRLHAELRRARLTRRGATHQPKDVPRFTHKEYPRMQLISLPEPGHLATTLQEALERRSSAFSGDSAEPLALHEIGTLLGLSLRARRGGTRNYPSGGALYPVETYLISSAIETQTPAVFHYNPTKHALERLWDLPAHFNLKNIAARPESLPVSTMILFTSVWRRSSAKYGDLTYLHALIEAGHMSENILLVGTALHLNVRPYAGFSDNMVSDLLDLDEENEQPIHSITLCKGAERSSGAQVYSEE